jgi:hypothetical protein
LARGVIRADILGHCVRAEPGQLNHHVDTGILGEPPIQGPYRDTAGALITDLSTPDNAQAQAVAEIIQRANPDIILINEFDYDADGTAATLFADNYLGISQNGAAPVAYPYRFIAPSNTGIASGFDLNNDGAVEGPDDAFGFGFFPGQFGMAVYSKFPIDEASIRTFQNFLWQDMPDALLPDDPATPTPADWYTPEELAVFRLSSKSHWDLPIQTEGRWCICWQVIPRRPSSMGMKTAMAGGITMRFASGPTMSITRPTSSTI